MSTGPRLQNKVAIVSGGASGIGAACARVLAGEGYSLAALCRPEGFAGVNGLIDDVPVGKIRQFEVEFLAFLNAKHADVVKSIAEKRQIDHIGGAMLVLRRAEHIALQTVGDHHMIPDFDGEHQSS